MNSLVAQLIELAHLNRLRKQTCRSFLKLRSFTIRVRKAFKDQR